MRAGKLRRRLELQRPVEGRGVNGEITITWTHQAWIWGEFADYLSGAGPSTQDRVSADQRVSVAPRGRSLRIRKRGDVTTKSRIMDKHNAYEVIGIADSDDNRETTLTMKAVEIDTR